MASLKHTHTQWLQNEAFNGFKRKLVKSRRFKPSKHDQFVDGAVRQVCTYEEKDRDLVEASVRQGVA